MFRNRPVNYRAQTSLWPTLRKGQLAMVSLSLCIHRMEERGWTCKGHIRETCTAWHPLHTAFIGRPGIRALLTTACPLPSISGRGCCGPAFYRGSTAQGLLHAGVESNGPSSLRLLASSSPRPCSRETGLSSSVALAFLARRGCLLLRPHSQLSRQERAQARRCGARPPSPDLSSATEIP